MIEVGRACLKIAGREAGKHCVVVDVVSESFVIIDGEVKRRKCNVAHLEPLDKKLEIGKSAPHDVVVEELRKLGLYKERAKPAHPAASGKKERKPEVRAAKEKKVKEVKQAKEVKAKEKGKKIQQEKEAKKSK